jgi:uncharacterized RDD family membrane protein YckC
VYCSKCGNAMAAGSTFCSNCGQPAAAPAMLSPALEPALAVPAGSFPVSVQLPMAVEAVPSYRFTLVYAGFWLRFVAYLIDALILGICLGPILVGLALTMGVGAAFTSLAASRDSDAFAAAFAPVFLGFMSLAILIGTIGAWLYHALLECSDWQGTAGKKALGLKVTDLSGARVSFARASGRHFAKIISGLIPLGIGYILAGFTERKQAIHDMVAACLVLRS